MFCITSSWLYKEDDLALKKGITKIICIAVNDPNVMKAWGEGQNTGTKILWLAILL